MAQEKAFETRLRSWLHSQGIYQAGMPEDKQREPPCGWYVKYWGGGMGKAGIPDLIMCVNGIFVAVETKSKTGKPTDLQRKNIQMVNLGGGIGLVLYPEGFEQFKNIIKGVVNCSGHIAGLNALMLANTNTKCDTLTS